VIIVDKALARLEAEGRPLRVAIVGAGFQGAAIVRQVVSTTRAIRVAGVAGRQAEAAVRAFTDAGVEPTCTDGRTRVERAIADGIPVATEDVIGLVTADGIDVVVEVTGSVEYAAQAILAAIQAGKHVVQMNAELDGTIGPILKVKADAAGILYSFADGDQPGVQMNLFRFVRGIGVNPRLCGNIKGLHDSSRNPETQRGFAEKWGQKPAMVASFADGTKIAFEQAVVANGTGFRVARRGMIGHDFSGGDPSAPLVPIEDALAVFREPVEASEHGLVDYVVGARPGPGVFVIGTHDDPRQRHFLNLYKMGPGPYYCFYTPYHLCHFEVPNSIARAALFGDAVLAPRAGPEVGVIAVAKKNLAAGDVIEEFGGFEAYGVAENHATIEEEGLLPMGLALGARLVRRIAQNQPLTVADVALPEGRLCDQLYAEQRAHFAAQRKAA
jgi:predicted homoserine dehydrogenase-like protein